MEEKIRVIKCEVGKKAKEKIINSDLKSLQQEVGGYIEPLYLKENICIICDEEGKVRQKPLNRAIRGDDDKIEEIIAGDFFICGLDEEGDFRSLNDEEINEYLRVFKLPEEILILNNEIIAVPYEPMQRVNSYENEKCL